MIIRKSEKETVQNGKLLLDRNRESPAGIFSFETEDFEAASAYVRDNGFRLADEPKRFHDMAAFALLDPDGNRIAVARKKSRQNSLEGDFFRNRT